jgi:predicted peroxiredoxin
MDQPPELRKLIFYSTVGPDRDNNAWQPFTMAKRALDAGLDCEIFLAGPATGLMRKAVRDGQEGRQREALQAVIDAKVLIRFSPG